MYVPLPYRETQAEAVLEVIKKYPFGILVSYYEGSLTATHIPFAASFESNAIVLYSHMSRANAQWRSFNGAEAMAMFVGPHGYISPSWYAAQRDVPTWDYVAVHVYGRPSIVQERAEVLDMMTNLVAQHEPPAPGAWNLSYLSQAEIDGALSGIVAFRMQSERFEASYKLSQTRPAHDQDSVVAHLAQSENAGDRALAMFITEHRAHATNKR